MPAMAHSGSNSNSILPAAAAAREPVYWRVEGSLLELGAMRPVGFFTWNSQSFSERWARRLGMAGMALARPFAYAATAPRCRWETDRSGSRRGAHRASGAAPRKYPPSPGPSFRDRFVHFQH